MNVEVKTRWVAALRSGDYAQGFGRLCSVDEKSRRSYCCLGVLCELAVEAGVATSVEYRVDDDVTIRYGDDLDRTKSNVYLPLVVCEWAGLTSMNPTVDGRTLSNWNDGVHPCHDGVDFDRIADLIKEYL